MTTRIVNARDLSPGDVLVTSNRHELLAYVLSVYVHNESVKFSYASPGFLFLTTVTFPLREHFTVVRQ